LTVFSELPAIVKDFRCGKDPERNRVNCSPGGNNEVDGDNRGKEGSEFNNMKRIA
jgi:hypothetical protein